MTIDNQSRAIEDLMNESAYSSVLKNDSPTGPDNEKILAHECLTNAAEHLTDRASTYDSPQGERSMARTVDTFTSLTGIEMTEEQGWMFMSILKMVRSQQGNFKLDNYEDGAAYFALAAEAASEGRL
jgi:hypothetical protein|tara:strand:- start:980 stop:1360 length:381 start_codon:yes stop_codon:yes gene_type:complete